MRLAGGAWGGDCSLSSVLSAPAALGGPTEEELLELLDQCDLALTRTPDSTPRASTCRYAPPRTTPPFEKVKGLGCSRPDFLCQPPLSGQRLVKGGASPLGRRARTLRRFRLIRLALR